MKPFNLELAKQGKPVCTRDGKPARIICFDKKGNPYPLVALVKYDKEENTYTYTNDGRITCTENDLDLMMASEKHEGWVNIYHSYTNNNRLTNHEIFDTEEKAMMSSKNYDNYITTTKIEWEE